MRSMEHGRSGLVLLHLNDEAYTQKPPLFFWLAAALGAPFGHVSETAARLPSALAGVALVALLLRFGASLLGGPTATIGAALLLTTFPFARAARRAQLDVLLALFETLALVAFWRLDRGIGRRRNSLLLFHGAVALGLLTKGPVAFLIPVLIIASFLVWERRLGDLRHLFPWWSPLLSLGPILAWTGAAVALAPVGYFDVAVTENLIGRFFSGTSHARPFYYFAYQFPVLMAPWVLWLPVLLWIGASAWPSHAGGQMPDRVPGPPERTRALRYLVVWIVASFVFFSLSSGKRGIYLLPALPAVALLMGHGLRTWVASVRGIPWLYHLGTGLAGVALAGAGVYLVFRDPLDAPTASLAVGVGVVATVVVTAALQVLARQHRAPTGLRLGLPIGAAFVVELLIFNVGFPALDPEKSSRAVAEAAAALTLDDAPPGLEQASRVGLVFDRPLIGGLRYYGGSPVTELASDEEIEAFFAAGGRALVIQRRFVERFPSLESTETRFQARSGRRALVVRAPRDG